MFGVSMTELLDSGRSGCIWQERPFQDWSSDRRKRKLGRSAECAFDAIMNVARMAKSGRIFFI
jgi:hypothetical protein